MYLVVSLPAALTLHEDGAALKACARSLCALLRAGFPEAEAE